MEFVNSNSTTGSIPYKPVLMLDDIAEDELRGPFIPGFRLSATTRGAFERMLPVLKRSGSPFVLQWNEPAINDGLFGLLMHGLFSADYLFEYNDPVVAFGSRLDEQVIETLVARIRQQGFERVRVWQAAEVNGSTAHGPAPGSAPGPVGGHTDPLYITAGTTIDEQWITTNLLTGFSRLNNYLIFDLADPAKAMELNGFVASVCNRYLSDNPVLAKAYADYLSVHEEYGVLKTGADQLAQQLSAAEKTVGVIRTKYKDDYENLFRWYHNEYEILPLWYKRFGHVLKVLMGKRSFRSLFSDEVKKYKD